MKLFKKNNKKKNKVENTTTMYEVIYIDNTTGKETVKIMTERELDALNFEGWCDIFSFVALKKEA